jgi:hypothetical protein
MLGTEYSHCKSFITPSQTAEIILGPATLHMQKPKLEQMKFFGSRSWAGPVPRILMLIVYSADESSSLAPLSLSLSNHCILSLGFFKVPIIVNFLF